MISTKSLVVANSFIHWMWFYSESWSCLTNGVCFKYTPCATVQLNVPVRPSTAGTWQWQLVTSSGQPGREAGQVLSTLWYCWRWN